MNNDNDDSIVVIVIGNDNYINPKKGGPNNVDINYSSNAISSENSAICTGACNHQ